jgi:hypothetical protein
LINGYFLLSLFGFWSFAFHVHVLRFRPKSGMKNCNLLNRIVPRAYQSPRNFTNGSAESLGTKLLYGRVGTFGKPVIARRNHAKDAHHRLPKKVSSMISPASGVKAPVSFVQMRIRARSAPSWSPDITSERSHDFGASAPMTSPPLTGTAHSLATSREAASRLRFEWIAAGCTAASFWTASRRLISGLEGPVGLRVSWIRLHTGPIESE